MPRLTLTLALSALALVLFPSLALADDWSDALHAELEAGDDKKAIKLYRKVAKAKGPHAAHARLRRIDLLAKAGKTTSLKSAITAFLQAHPQHAQAAAMRAAKGDAQAYIKKVQARPDPAKRNAAVRKKLSSQRISLNFNATPVRDVVGFIRDITGINVTTLSDVPKTATVTLKLKNQTLEDTMLEIVKGPKLAWNVIGGVIVIGANAAAVQGPSFTAKQVAKNPGAFLKLKTNTVTLNFPDTPLGEVAQFIRDITGLSVTVDPAVAQRSVSVRLKNTTLGEALALITANVGAQVELTASGLALNERKRK